MKIDPISVNETIEKIRTSLATEKTLSEGLRTMIELLLVIWGCSSTRENSLLLTAASLHLKIPTGPNRSRKRPAEKSREAKMDMWGIPLGWCLILIGS